MATNATHPLDRFLLQRMQEGNISSTALVFTFFCDVVTQHGGEIWLGSIIQTLAPLGINERLTRTSMFRLVQDGWLESRKQGRRSYYRLTKPGKIITNGLPVESMPVISPNGMAPGLYCLPPWFRRINAIP